MPVPGMSPGLTTGISPVGIGSLQALPARFHPSVSRDAGAVPASLPQSDIYNIRSFSSVVQPGAPPRDDTTSKVLYAPEFHEPAAVFRSPAPGLGYTSNSGSLQPFGLQPRSIARSFADGPQHDLHQPAFTPPTAKTPSPR